MNSSSHGHFAADNSSSSSTVSTLNAEGSDLDGRHHYDQLCCVLLARAIVSAGRGLLLVAQQQHKQEGGKQAKCHDGAKSSKAISMYGAHSRCMLRAIQPALLALQQQFLARISPVPGTACRPLSDDVEVKELALAIPALLAQTEQLLHFLTTDGSVMNGDVVWLLNALKCDAESSADQGCTGLLAHAEQLLHFLTTEGSVMNVDAVPLLNALMWDAKSSADQGCTVSEEAASPSSASDDTASLT
eukprot:gene5472-5707_t